MTTTLITQRQAVKAIRTRTGLSHRTATGLVKRMDKTPDGERQKVRTRDVENVIRIYNEPILRTTSIRPLSLKHRLAMTLKA